MEKDQKGELVGSILKTSDRLFRNLLPTVPQELINLDVTMPQLKIMIMLFMHGPMRMSAIAAEMSVALPTATSFIDRLVEKNFVARESLPNDRRVVLCRLIEGGQKAIDRIWESGRLNLGAILEEMDINKLQMLFEVLQYMLDRSDIKLESVMANDTFKGKVHVP
jgi:DNA-binding MarR family transcriptional regulator